ncbi:MAG: LuxR C-terminal-related transcriptional regulator [Pseudonocardiaceae bacterium]
MCGGNPFYALEIARAVRHQGGQAHPGGGLPLPKDVMASTADRMAALSPAARDALAVVAEASGPSVALVVAVTGDQAADGLAEAVVEGLLELDGERVRFTHPILRFTVAANRSGRQRRALHRRLAQLVDNPDQRAVHLAAGASAPDEAVALALEEAAHRAFLQGAPDTAADLAGRAVALTPVNPGTVAARRKIIAAEYHYRVEELDMARAWLQEVIAELPAGGIRAEALLWLGTVVYDQGSPDEACTHVRQAIAEAADDHVRAAAERHLALYLEVRGDPVVAEPYAQAALRTAQASGDLSSIAESSGILAWTQFLLGRGLHTDLLTVASNTTWTPYSLHVVRPRLLEALILCWSGQIGSADTMLRVEARVAREHGLDRVLALVLYNLAELECLAGRWDRASEHVAEGYRAAVLANSDFVRCLLLAVRGLVSAHRGRLDDARADAERGMMLCADHGFDIGRPLHLALLAYIELCQGNYAAVHRLLAPLLRSLPSGDFEPGLARFVLDEAEALVALGELARADELLTRFEAQAVRLDRPWALLAAGRARSLWAAAGGDLDAAVAAADAALAAGELVEMPFERARTLLVAGSVRRRARRRREAREMLSAALAEFDRLGSPLWADRTRAELDRISGRAPSPGDLTDAERRIAEIVAAGRTNREVATELCLAVSTVEAALWKIYRKLDVRSRTELAARFTTE